MKKRIGQLMVVSCILVGIAGCGRAKGDTETSDPAANAPAQSSDAAADDTSDDTYVVGQGFRPPKGSHRDSRGYIVDPEGNTFDDEGGWQVPEGGWVDSQGRIRDKNGNLVGGGAMVGAKG